MKLTAAANRARNDQVEVNGRHEAEAIAYTKGLCS